jgi:nucleoid-associated protein YgaU
LWAIAKKYYGDGNKYTEIAKANNISNPNVISVGQKLLIP